METRYTPFPQSALARFSLSILRSVPQLALQLKGQVNPEAYYYAVKSSDHDQYYFWYRFKSKMQYPHLSTSQKSQALLSREEFAQCQCAPDTADLYAATLVALMVCLEEIISQPSMVFDTNGNYYQTGNPPAYIDLLVQLVKTRLYSPETPEDMASLDDGIGQLFENEVDLSPVYLFVFSRLKANGLDWKYHSGYLDLIRRTENEQDNANEYFEDLTDEDEAYDPSVYEPGTYDPEEEQYDQLGDKTFESTYFEEINKEPEPIIQAYIHVYGKLPEGYPPRMDEY